MRLAARLAITLIAVLGIVSGCLWANGKYAGPIKQIEVSHYENYNYYSNIPSI